MALTVFLGGLLIRGSFVFVSKGLIYEGGLYAVFYGILSLKIWLVETICNVKFPSQTQKICIGRI